MVRYRIGGRQYGRRGGSYRVTRWSRGAFAMLRGNRYARRSYLPSWGRKGRRRMRNPLRAGAGNYYRALGR